MKIKLSSAALLTSLGFLACDRDGMTGQTGDTPEMTTQAQRAPEAVRDARPQTASATAPGTAVDQITRARCDREARCNEIGAGKAHATRDACMTDIREEWRDDLNAYECRGGIVQEELDECLAEIRNEACANPFDALGRIAACRSSDICKAMVP